MTHFVTLDITTAEGYEGQITVPVSHLEIINPRVKEYSEPYEFWGQKGTTKTREAFYEDVDFHSTYVTQFDVVDDSPIMEYIAENY